eukprot:TRINITY_DN102966_c0_g1_i1.p1 TRINITY_DN102966_c0_g1~~TRINITY_DN102966_c0_g1_i1.p1  ORF type:complete len:711 (-),score=102.70 TRINITY_DN102966_c0_g1_i1:67-2166(-)
MEAECAECPICLGSLKHPVVCPCPGRHAFCRQCLRGTLNLQCPVCRDKSDVVIDFVFRRSEPLRDRAVWRAGQLRAAAEAGHSQVIRSLLRMRSPVDTADDDFRTPLHLACKSGKQEIVQLLLQGRASSNRQDYDGNTPLHWAAITGHTGIAQDLLEAGAHKNRLNEHSETPLYLACAEAHLEFIKLLFARRADAHKGTKHSSVLHAASSSPEGTEVVRYLIEERSMDPMHAERGRHTPLHVASIVGAEDTVRYLLQRLAGDQLPKAVNAQTRGLETPAFLAAMEGHDHIVRELVAARASVNSINKVGASTLAQASARGHLPTVQALIELRAQVQRKDPLGETAMHAACLGGHADVVKELVSHGVLADDPKCSRAPLFYAARHGHVDVVRELLAARANVNRTGYSPACFDMGFFEPEHLTPLQVALQDAADASPPLELVALLLEHRASPHGGRGSVAPPLQLAAEAGYAEPVRLLLEAGAAKNKKDFNGQTALHCSVIANHTEATKLLLQGRAQVDTEDYEGLTPLMYSVEKGYVEIFRLLLESKASVNKVTQEGQTALLLASETQVAPRERGLGSGRGRLLTIVRELLQARARPDLPGGRGLDRGGDLPTPLRVAVFNGDLSLVRLLVLARADTSAAARGGCSLEDDARRVGHNHVAAFLQREHDSSTRPANRPTQHSVAKRPARREASRPLKRKRKD